MGLLTERKVFVNRIWTDMCTYHILYYLEFLDLEWFIYIFYLCTWESSLELPVYQPLIRLVPELYTFWGVCKKVGIVGVNLDQFGI